MTCKKIAALCPAYLSGEMEAPSARAFAEHLRICRACNEEVERQLALDSLLRRSVLSVKIDTAALDRKVRAQIAFGRRSFSTRWLAVVAGLAAILLAGILGYRAMMPQPPALCVDAARDHRSEVTLAQHRRWLSDRNAVADLAQRNGIPASLIATLAPPAYHFEHGKLCRLGHELFLHLVYSQGGSEFSVYLRFSGSRPLAGAENPLRAVRTGGEHIAYVQTNRYTAVFVTDRSSSAALSLARSAASVLRVASHSEFAQPA